MHHLCPRGWQDRAQQLGLLPALSIQHFIKNQAAGLRGLSLQVGINLSARVRCSCAQKALRSLLLFARLVHHLPTQHLTARGPSPPPTALPPLQKNQHARGKCLRSQVGLRLLRGSGWSCGLFTSYEAWQVFVYLLRTQRKLLKSLRQYRRMHSGNVGLFLEASGDFVQIPLCCGLW